MATISSDTLFHFTDSLENLLNIIKHGFVPQYSIENLDFIHDSNKSFEYAFPMLCFCDIPLSQIDNHLDVYGSYGIGLRKKWGFRNNLSPILYLDEESNLSSSLFNLFHNISDNKFEDEIVDITRYIKPYEGQLNGEKYRFYDEREWRYVPEIDSKVSPVMAADNIKNETDFYEKSRKLIKEFHTLSIKPEDIKYLIVSKEKEIHEIIENINELKGDQYTANEMKLVNSKVISSTQIKNDF